MARAIEAEDTLKMIQEALEVPASDTKTKKSTGVKKTVKKTVKK